MEGILEQNNIFELTEDQREISTFILEELEMALEQIDVKDLENKKVIKEFMEKRAIFQDELEEDGVDFSHIYLWHILVGSTIPGAGKIKSFDTPDGRIEKFIREKLLPIIKKGE